MLPRIWHAFARRVLEASEEGRPPAGESWGIRVPPVHTAIDSEPTPEEVFHAASLRFLELQVSTLDILDTRNAGIFSVGSTVLPLTFGLLTVAQTDIPFWAKVAFVAAVVCYVLVLITSWRASLIRGLEFRPHIPTLARNRDSYSGPILQDWVAREYAASSDANADVVERKARWVGAANTLVYLEGLCLSIAALVSLL